MSALAGLRVDHFCNANDLLHIENNSLKPILQSVGLQEFIAKNKDANLEIANKIMLLKLKEFAKANNLLERNYPYHKWMMDEEGLI